MIPVKVSSNREESFKLHLMGRLETGGCPKGTIFKAHLWRANHVPGVRQLPGEQDTVPALPDLPASRGALQHIGPHPMESSEKASRRRPSPEVSGDLRSHYVQRPRGEQASPHSSFPTTSFPTGTLEVILVPKGVWEQQELERLGIRCRCGSPHIATPGHGWVELCARAGGRQARVRKLNTFPCRTPQFIPGTLSEVALETSENVTAMGASRKRSQNANESEGESVRFPTENSWHM